ncbi:hypothetical protein H1V43_36720 [Streptomyces sp. PSKA54]|uniref:DUF4064 domain-containing protein n=1 Tax=Streptomyces himalayensis subsp. aureolus TaxID=2758039 RepID=A0A7W2HK29_9ACTN|nr:hypothetical protein [Streptomyces himalayensis]MBA4866745.1 hypothetical protein [Streptomyces himalayensis subsp. aureolus]
MSAPAPAGVTLRRTAEVWVAGAGLVLSTLFLGAFTLVMNRLDEAEFSATLYPEMQRIGLDLTAGGAVAGDAYDAARTLAAWFGLTLMAVLFSGITGIFVARRRPGRRTAGWFFAATGLVCLVGSQLVLYPVAFLFFVSAGLFALRRSDRRPDVGSTR